MRHSMCALAAGATMRSRGNRCALLVACAMLAGCARATPAPVDGSAVAAVGSPLRYVSSGGDDRAAGSANTPWRTVQHAVEASPAGAIVTVRPGRYRGFDVPGRVSRLTVRGPARGGRPVFTHPPRGAGDTIRLHGVDAVRLQRLVVSGARGKYNAGVSVRRSRGVDLDDLVLRGNQSFGVEVADSSDVDVTRSAIARNETGIQLSRSARVRVERNDLFRNDRMVVDDAAPHNDRGANAVVVYRTPGPVRIAGNRAWGNRARSTDYGYDGGAFEIYGSSRVSIVGNRVWNNQNVVETGAPPGGECTGNEFARNVAFRGRSTGPTMGMILRCARDMRVTDNTFYDLDRFVFDVTAEATRFGGAVDGLTIVGNRAVSRRDKIYSIDSALPASVRIDGQLVHNEAGGPIAYVFGRGQTRSLERFREWTGYEQSGRDAAPGFRHPERGDFRRVPGSAWTTP